MNELKEHTFNTKTGICIVTPEKIELKRTGIKSQVAKQVYGNSIYRTLSIYIFLGVIAITIGIWNLFNRDYAIGVIFEISGVVFLINVFTSRNNSATNIIQRSAVQRVVFKYPHPPFTRGGIIVHFSEDGKKRKRLIFLPGSMSGGKKEFKRALSVMRETGWCDS